jgi:hypothetical protein
LPSTHQRAEFRGQDLDGGNFPQVALGSAHQNTNTSLTLNPFGTGGHRPHRRRTADKRHEFAPLHSRAQTAECGNVPSSLDAWKTSRAFFERN